MPLAPAPPLAVTDTERRELSQLTSARNAPQGIALRARIILGAADGVANNVLARELSTSLPTVLWRRRFQEQGLMGILEDRRGQADRKRLRRNRKRRWSTRLYIPSRAMPRTGVSARWRANRG